MKRVGVVSTAFLSCVLLAASPSGYAQQKHDGEKQGKQGQAERAPRQNAGQQQHVQAQQRAQRQNTGQQQHAQQQQRAQQQNAGQQQHAQQQQRAQQQNAGQQQHAQAQQRAQRQNTGQQQHAQQQQRVQQPATRFAQQQPARTQPARVQRTALQQRSQQGEQRVAWQQHRASSFVSEHRTWQQRGGYSGYRIPEQQFRGYYGQDHWFRVYSLPFMVVGGYPRFQYGDYWFSFIDPYPEYWGDNWYQTDDVYVDYYNDGYYLYNRRYSGRPGIAINISL